MKEKWSMIDGYRNYAVSSLGRIRNLNTGQLLKHQSSKRGGYYAFINLSRNGKRVNRNVHILVAHAFLGLTPNGKIVHHIDNDRMHATLDNLDFKTVLENNNPANRKGG